MSPEQTPNDQEVRKWIRNLKQHQVSEEFTARVMSEARSLMDSPSARERVSVGSILRWITGWRSDAAYEGISLMPAMTRIALAMVTLGIGIGIWNHAFKPAPANLMTQEVEAVTRELASLETAFEWLESDPVQENLSLSTNARTGHSDSGQAWIGELQQVQAIALEGVQPDEELLDLFGQTLP